MDLFNINKSLSSANELQVSNFGDIRFVVTDYSTGIKGSFMYEINGQLIRFGRSASFRFAVHKDCTVGQLFESLDAFFENNSVE